MWGVVWDEKRCFRSEFNATWTRCTCTHVSECTLIWGGGYLAWGGSSLSSHKVAVYVDS